MATESTYLGSPDNPRTTAMVSYITLIGWLAAFFFLYPSQRTSFSAYHLRQSLLIHIFSMILNILFSFTLAPQGWTGFIVIAGLAAILFFIWLKSFINALDGKAVPAPIIGRLAEKLFKGL